MLLDSIYTERYMLTPELNPDGYKVSAVNNMTGFQDTDFLLVHGTGDDNGKLIFSCFVHMLLIMSLFFSSFSKFCSAC